MEFGECREERGCGKKRRWDRRHSWEFETVVLFIAREFNDEEQKTTCGGWWDNYWFLLKNKIKIIDIIRSLNLIFS